MQALRLIPMESKIKPGRVGYIEGSGDEIPEILKDMGYEVVSLSDDMLTAEQLAQFNIVIAGIRAYNTRERLRFVQPLLMDFVKNGGTYIVQYNVPTGLQTENIGPYPFRIGRSRIVEEDAELRFLEPTTSACHFSQCNYERRFFRMGTGAGTLFCRAMGSALHSDFCRT